MSKSATSAFKDGDFAKCVKLYREAYIKSTNLEDNVVKTCTLNYGAALVVLGKTKLSVEDKKDAGISDLKSAIEILHKITPVYESQTHIDINADVYFNRAYAHQLLKENGKAIEFYKQAEKEYMRGRKIDQQLKCLHLIIQLHQEEKRFDMAAKVYKDMSIVYKFNNKKLEQADCLCQSMLLLMRNDAGKEEADKVANECMKCIKELELTGKDCVEAAKICNEVGVVQVELRNPDCESSFEKALELLNKSALPMSDSPLEAAFQQNLGEAYNIAGKYEEAIKEDKKAGDKYGQLKNRCGQAQCYINCAYAYSKLDYPNNLENANTYFLHALQAAKDSNDDHMMWQTYEGLGDISFQRGLAEEAKKYFQKAMYAVGKAAADKSVNTRIREKYDMMNEKMNRT